MKHIAVYSMDIYCWLLIIIYSQHIMYSKYPNIHKYLINYMIDLQNTLILNPNEE